MREKKKDKQVAKEKERQSDIFNGTNASFCTLKTGFFIVVVECFFQPKGGLNFLGPRSLSEDIDYFGIRVC